MKIGIVLHPYGQETGGLGRAILGLAQAMIERDEKNEYIIFLKGRPALLPHFSGSRWKIEALGNGRFWLEQRALGAADCHIFNTPVVPLTWRPRRSIVIALDFAYLHAGTSGMIAGLGRRTLRAYHEFSLRRADAIIAISQATKRDLMDKFGIASEKITVVYLGVNAVCVVPARRPDRVAPPFFFFVGAIKERKNVRRMVEAFEIFSRRHPEYQLLLAGRNAGSYADAIRARIARGNLEEKVLLPGFLSDEEISYGYQNAEALIFPSLLEGFGFPVIEAMSCGLPVITSNSSSLKELAGDGAALLVDPESVDEIAAAMEQVVADSAMRAALIEKGRARAAEFSWEKAARKTLALIEKIAETRSRAHGVV